jgi:hypothetical protein
MSKRTITWLFGAGVAAVLAGVVLGAAACAAAIASGVVVMDGPDVVGFNASAAGWTVVLAAIAGTVAIVGGAIAGLVSWVGALVNTAQLDDKVWFVMLLVLGVFSFGLIAMIAYVIAGPDGTEPHRASGQGPSIGGAPA